MFGQTDNVLSVSEINLQVRSVLERDPILEDFWVRGELSNVAFPASGHVYFSLKDNKSALKCVMWKSSLSALSRAELQSGNAVEVHGRIGVYERDGIYQLYADKIRKTGQGNLFEAFLKLKEKLDKEGLFDQSNKKELPLIPKVIGVVTSASGAALQDILNTLRKRWPLVEVRLSPAAVQGAEAPGELLQALQRLIKCGADVIIIARGGGSMEDLWSFNDEALVRAVATSPIPIISGVGHEIDFTLTDFAADLRAPTPTAAAVAAVPSQQDILIDLDQMSVRMSNATNRLLENRVRELHLLERRLLMQAPLEKIRQGKRSLDQLIIRAQQREKAYFEQRSVLLQGLQQRLDSVNPTTVMKRGYAVIRKDAHVVTSAQGLQPDTKISIHFYDGEKQARIE